MGEDRLIGRIADPAGDRPVPNEMLVLQWVWLFCKTRVGLLEQLQHEGTKITKTHEGA